MIINHTLYRTQDNHRVYNETVIIEHWTRYQGIYRHCFMFIDMKFYGNN
jgi:hypothetical protein